MIISDAEVEIALVALRHFSWRLRSQVNGSGIDCTIDAAWFSSRHCLVRAEALIARLEKEKAGTDDRLENP